MTDDSRSIVHTAVTCATEKEQAAVRDTFSPPHVVLQLRKHLLLVTSPALPPCPALKFSSLTMQFVHVLVVRYVPS